MTGSTIAFPQNGVQRITATDTSLTGGAPGIMANGTGQADNWPAATSQAAAPLRSAAPSPGCPGTVVLQDNGGDNLTLSANGTFTFATALANGAAYNVTVLTNPTGQTCTVSQRLGHHRLRQRHQRGRHLRELGHLHVGGTVSGLSGTVVLQDNGGDNLSLSANGSFTFATALATARPTT